MSNGITYVCPEKDIVCGQSPARWCAKCPLRAEQPAPTAVPAAVSEGERDMSRLRKNIGNAEYIEAYFQNVWGIVDELSAALKAQPSPCDRNAVLEEVAMIYENAGWMNDARMLRARKAQPAPTEAAQGDMRRSTSTPILPPEIAGSRMGADAALVDDFSAQGEDSARLDAINDVLAERRRQVEKEGWTPEHDDMHDGGQMAVAAGFYALQCGYPHERTHWKRGEAPMYWPWAASWWKPTTKRVNLVKAGALILAEIERIDRARATADTGSKP